MRNKSRALPGYSSTAQVLLAIIAFQLPVIGYCDSGNGWFSGWFDDLFELKIKKKKEMAKEIPIKMKEEAAKEIAKLNESEEIVGMDFSPDGKYLAAAGKNGADIHIWDWQSGNIVHTLEKAHGAFTGLTAEPIGYSPDGHLLAACHSLAQDDVVIRIWNTDTWEVVHDITDQKKGGGCNAIGFTPDGKLLIRVLDQLPEFPGDTFIPYSTDSWQPVWGLSTVPFQLGALAISPDGKFVALEGMVIPGGKKNYRQIAIVDLAQHAIARAIPVTKMNEFSMARIAWSPDGANIAIAGAGAVAVFDVSSGKQVAGESLKSAFMFIRYTPEGKYLLESDANGMGNGLGVRIWDGQHRKLIQQIPGDLNSLAVSRDGHYFTVYGNNNIQVWELK